MHGIFGDRRDSLVKSIWTPPAKWSLSGAWLWWFWIFFIHDKDTKKTGKCRQLMILWSIKNDKRIKCNSLEIRTQKQLEAKGDGKWSLNGAAAAWYFDNKQMHDDFVLERSEMSLDSSSSSLIAPGKTPSSFSLEGEEYITKIKAGGKEFEFRATQADRHLAVGPNYGKTEFPFGIGLEGTRIERLMLTGTETDAKGARKISGTAYFQKILVAMPPPPWYWGLYHFSDGSFFTYMLPYAGRSLLADNLWKGAGLKSPTLSLKQDIFLYHAPSGKVFEGNQLTVKTKRESNGLWSHEITGKGKGFEIKAVARAYSHSCWSFEKNIGFLPMRSTFKYNEYPSVLESLVLKTKDGKEISLKNGWGNMENAWGIII
ncbi:MAG: hypothetical protein NT051_01900 [Candidatus Micrarchaeota archaeon]|nr:hypothetical protein [Candidatus Micrarchaeota archaeon]